MRKNTILVMLILSLSLLFLNPSVLSKNQPEKLESVLYQLTQSTDPSEFAETRGLYFKDGKVRVVIELESKNGTVPTGYGIIEETRYENLVQAMVPIENLEEISKEQNIKVIRTPHKPSQDIAAIANKTTLPSENISKGFDLKLVSLLLIIAIASVFIVKKRRVRKNE